MTGHLEPLVTSDAIIATYHRYVKTLVDVRDERLAEAFADAVDNGKRLFKGPLLEATPAYSPGSSIRDLIEESVLDPGFASLDGPALPIDRPLYRHQEQAIRKVVAGRNVVVTTGTGSGKTESFLIPILNQLVSERSAGTLGTGVRALLLYPMNALANDQVKRLRGILSDHSDITFGRYTGETKERRADAETQFRAVNKGEARLSNELMSREEMRDRPPNILLTNYAMLEYLLLRPMDMELFSNSHWKFLALDEAHVYDGAKGAEIAMLLRRLQDRVAGASGLQCIATSATVDGDPPTIMNFASRLFGAEFDWRADDPTRQDLVVATRVTNPEVATWGPMTPDDIEIIVTSPDHDQALSLVASRWLPVGGHPGELLTNEASIVRLRAMLSKGPVPAADLARRLWPDLQDPKPTLDRLVSLAGRARDASENPVLSARYHLFIRATEGAFTCLSEQGPHVQLGRHDRCPDCDAACFEFGACQRCGAVYLAGRLEHVGKLLFFRPPSRAVGAMVWLILGDADEVLDEDDDNLDSSKTSATSHPALLCASCGLLNGPADASCAHCGDRALRVVRRYDKPQTAMGSCARCGARAYDVVRRLSTGSDAPPSVLTTSLYQQIPSADGDAAEYRGEGRKLLLFSDSRQAAAFAAPYLQNTYGRLQERRLIVQGLSRATAQGAEIGFRDLLFHTVEAATSAGFFRAVQTSGERQREVELWLMCELVSIDHRQSLEGLGLVRVHHRRPSVGVPSALTRIGLSEAESWDLLEELTRTMRQQGAISMPPGVQANDDRFAPRTGPIYMRGHGSEVKRKVMSWSPTRGTNRRADYVTRVLARLSAEVDVVHLLNGAWGFIEKSEWLRETQAGALGAVSQDNYEALRFVDMTADRPYRCTKCRRVSATSVQGVCPTIACDGELQAFALPEAVHDDQHYRHLYRNLLPVPMSAMEHTAQWTSTKAAQIQADFVEGKINVLSCSTTFELGVDVGDLQSVVMRNMPPTTANYVQRAGRAGRRADSAALVLTFAQRRSHDLSRFQTPDRMIAGKMRAPIVPLDNERIGRRHTHSVALAAFFRSVFLSEGLRWSKAGEFFIPPDGESTAPVDRVRGYLSPVPGAVLTSLRRVLPASLQVALEVESSGWVEPLCDLLDSVRNGINTEVAEFLGRQEEAVAAKKWSAAQQMERTIKTVVERDLLGFLGNRNVLPKYGFPVDTVELRTIHSGEAAGRELELSRDLTQAIYDYAPGNQVIAGGRRWTSAGVYRLPGKELITKRFQVCASCGKFEDGELTDTAVCSACGSAWPGQVRTYVIPEFGFVSKSESEDVGTAPPERNWNGATHVQSLGAEIDQAGWRAPNGQVVNARAGARGKLIAISDGIGNGYYVCDWCGWGQVVGLSKVPRSHPRPLNNKECTGPLSRFSLGHSFETDMVELTFPSLGGVGATDDQWMSMLYAVVEGASEALEISRDDIDGSLYWTETGARAIVLFDTVPGGAGGARLIAQSLGKVVAGAIARVDDCECGVETSCYACLRGYRNGIYHDQLSRGGALKLLDLLRSSESRRGIATAALPPQWQLLVDYAVSDVEVQLLAQLAGAGVPLPEQGFEDATGWPLALAWPLEQVAVVDGDDLAGAGTWTFIAIADPDAAIKVCAALAVA